MPEEFIWCLEFAVKEIEQIDVGFSCICPVIGHEFHHNIVNVAVDPRDDSQVDLQTTLKMLQWNSLSLTEQTDEKLTSIFFLWY